MNLKIHLVHALLGRNIVLRSLSGIVYLAFCVTLFLNNDPVIYGIFSHIIFLIMLVEFCNIVHSHKWQLALWGEIVLVCYIFMVCYHSLVMGRQILFPFKNNIDITALFITVIWYLFAPNSSANKNETYTRSNPEIKLWLLGCYAYSIVFIKSIFFLKMAINSHNLVLIFFVICLTDIFAYVIGNICKGPKLAPKISPKKTWSGLIGGMTCGTLFYYHAPMILKSYCPDIKVSEVSILTAILIPIIGAFGDLTQSKLKRTFNVKDSGTIVLGHGGLLDRIDSLSMVFIVLSIYHVILSMIQ